MKYAKVQIPLSAFDVDVYVGNGHMKAIAKERYDYDADDWTENEAGYFIANGKIQFYLKLKSLSDTPAFFHELWHLTWQICNIISDFKLNYNTQNWSANFVEHLARNILTAKYEKI